VSGVLNVFQKRLWYPVQLFLNLCQGSLKSSTAMRTRGALVEDLFALQFQCLALPLFICGLGRGLLSCLRWALAVSLPIRKLFLDRFTFPTSRHTLMLMPILAHPLDIHPHRAAILFAMELQK